MHPIDVIVVTVLAQALAALVLAGLLWLFQRSREYRYLKLLALAFLTLSLHLGCLSIALTIGQHGVPASGLHGLFAALALIALFPSLAWLSIGLLNALRQRPTARRKEYGLVALAAVAGAGLGLMAVATTDPPSADILRISIPYGVAAAVFLGLSWHLNRARPNTSALISPILGVTAFGLMGLFLLSLSIRSLFLALDGQSPFQSPFVALLGLLALGLVGLSIVIWLLENEQEKARRAHQKAASAEQRLRFITTHDAATGLPNRRQFQNQLSQEILQSQENSERRVAVLALGIHRFKDISEAVGWQRTEDMMSDLTRRIRDKLPGHFTLGRIGERDFIVMMPNLRRPDAAIAHAHKILARIRLPFEIRGQRVFLAVSGGLSIGPDHSDDAVTLVNQAHRAQLRSTSASEQLTVHDAGDRTMQPGDLVHKETDLRRACEEDQFEVFYQPLVSIRKRCIVGFEALLRWHHPTRGLLGPDHFLQDATSLGLLDRIEAQVFTKALTQLADWHSDLSLAPVSVAINLSAERFQQPDLPDQMVELCRIHGVSPGYLDLELTENAAITDFEAGLDTIGRLREQGIQVSLDDFGTGYSALAHLQRLRVDYVKLDRSFLHGIDHDEHQRALTHAIIELIHSLGMPVLAEGVETRSQLQQLIQCRVDYVQGFLLGRPRPAADYQTLLEKKYITAL